MLNISHIYRSKITLLGSALLFFIFLLLPKANAQAAEFLPIPTQEYEEGQTPLDINVLDYINAANSVDDVFTAFYFVRGSSHHQLGTAVVNRERLNQELVLDIEVPKDLYGKIQIDLSVWLKASAGGNILKQTIVYDFKPVDDPIADLVISSIKNGDIYYENTNYIKIDEYHTIWDGQTYNTYINPDIGWSGTDVSFLDAPSEDIVESKIYYRKDGGDWVSIDRTNLLRFQAYYSTILNPWVKLDGPGNYELYETATIATGSSTTTPIVSFTIIPGVDPLKAWLDIELEGPVGFRWIYDPQNTSNESPAWHTVNYGSGIENYRWDQMNWHFSHDMRSIDPAADDKSFYFYSYPTVAGINASFEWEGCQSVESHDFYLANGWHENNFCKVTLQEGAVTPIKVKLIPGPSLKQSTINNKTIDPTKAVLEDVARPGDVIVWDVDFEVAPTSFTAELSSGGVALKNEPQITQVSDKNWLIEVRLTSSDLPGQLKAVLQLQNPTGIVYSATVNTFDGSSVTLEEVVTLPTQISIEKIYSDNPANSQLAINQTPGNTVLAKISSSTPLKSAPIVTIGGYEALVVSDGDHWLASYTFDSKNPICGSVVGVEVLSATTVDGQPVSSLPFLATVGASDGQSVTLRMGEAEEYVIRIAPLVNGHDLANQDGPDSLGNVTSTSWFGNASSIDHSYLGLRFQDLNIPLSASLEQASLTIENNSSNQWTSSKFNIQMEDILDPQSFIDGSLLSERSYLSEKIFQDATGKWDLGASYSWDVLPLLKSWQAKHGTMDDISLRLQGASGGPWGRKFFTFDSKNPSPVYLDVKYYHGTCAALDVEPPTITLQSIYSNHPVDGAIAHLDPTSDTITAVFETSEPLKSAPAITLAGQVAQVSGSGTDWTAEYKLNSSWLPIEDTIVEVVVSQAFDLSGNQAALYTTTQDVVDASQVTIVVDKPTVFTRVLTPRVNGQDVANQDGQQMDAYFSSQAAWFGNGKSVDKSYLGLRFLEADIPAGATIKEARLKINNNRKLQWTSTYFQFLIEDSITPSPYSNQTLLSDRVYLAPSKEIDAKGKWNVGDEFVWDIYPQVEALYGKYGTIEDLSLILKGTANGSFGRKFFSFDELNSPVELEIVFEVL